MAARKPDAPGPSAEICILLHAMARLELQEHQLVLAMLEHLCPEKTDRLHFGCALETSLAGFLRAGQSICGSYVHTEAYIIHVNKAVHIHLQTCNMIV